MWATNRLANATKWAKKEIESERRNILSSISIPRVFLKMPVLGRGVCLGTAQLSDKVNEEPDCIFEGIDLALFIAINGLDGNRDDPASHAAGLDKGLGLNLKIA